MGARSVITLTTGPAGSGKTYVRCARFLLDEWLPERSGVHYSNFPVFRDKVAEFSAKKTGKLESEILDRIQIIPESTLDLWVNGHSGPWDFFRDKNLDGCHIAIDECHNFCGAKTNHKIRQRWQAWLGEIRHQGATVEFLSQSPEKVAKEIHYEAGLRLSLVNSEDRRDPFLGILLGDWYELKAAFVTKEYQTVVWEIERRNVDGKWIEQNKRVFTLDPFYFQFYDSFSRPVQGGEKATGQKREFEKRSKPALIRWFLRRNVFSIAPRAMLVGGVLYLCMGGSSTVMGLLLRTFEAAATNNAVKLKPAPKKQEPSAKIDAPVAITAKSKPSEAVAQKVPEIMGPPKPSNHAVTTVLPHAPSPEKSKDAVVATEASVVRHVRLVLIAKDRIALDDGRIIRVGEALGTLLLQEVDSRRRECVLTGGKRVRLGDTLDGE